MKFLGGRFEGEKMVLVCFYENTCSSNSESLPRACGGLQKTAPDSKICFRKSPMMLENVTEFRNFFHSFMYEDSFGKIFRINKYTHTLDASRNVII